MVVGGDDIIGGVHVVVGIRWGGGGVVRMVVDGVGGGGLVRGAGGCGMVGGSSVFRGYLLPSVSPSAAILAFGLARVGFSSSSPV